MRRVEILSLAVVAWASLALVCAPAWAAAVELVMVEEKLCPWCAQWNQEVGVIYEKTEEGRRAPLRRVDIHSAEINNLTLKSRAHYTPTFILMQNGEEVGRIEGYPGEDFFWGFLGNLLEKVPVDASAQ
ncbi:MAG: hypothetical protein KTR21_16070 [Rhodobacteraceae bacterium]|nr:hypothetical protein [Paracoccaceae bacterium]